MADQLVNIFQDSLGVGNVDDAKSAAFQPPAPDEQRKTLVREADNLDLYRDGSWKSRQGRTKVRTLTNGHSGWACQLGAFYVDSGSLYQFNPGGADTLIQAGLNEYAEVSYEEVAGQVFWANGSQTGCIVGEAAAPWGLLATNPPTLDTASGGLRAGRYLVAIAAVSATGVEGGARAASEITLGSGGGISASVAGVDSQAAALNVYLSDTNGRDLFYHSTVPVGDFTITSPAGTIDLFTGLGGFHPPAGHLVRQHGGFLIVATDDGLYFSEPGNPHRFHLETDYQLLPSRPVMLEPLPDGFYYALERGGTFWVRGTDPRKLQVQQVDDRLVSEQRCSLRVPASKLPWLQSDLDVPVPIWATQDGWAAGLPGGMVKYPVGGRVAMDANRKATGAYVEQPGLKQLMLSMRNKAQANRLVFSDAATATVTRGGVPIA